MNLNKLNIIMILFLSSCLYYPSKTTIDNSLLTSNDCELERFSNFRIYKSFDKNRICVYSPRRKLLKIIQHNSNHNKLYNLSAKEVITGLDIAEADQFHFLNQTKFALLTNSTGVNKDLNNILEILIHHNKKPSLLMEPEHGIFGSEDEVFNQIIRYEKHYQIPILNLYSRIKKPPLNYLKQIDSIIIDIQNLPVRCYTYISTLTYLLETADLLQKEIIILDRPHPYGIWKPMGHFLQEGYESFVGEAPVPFLYSLTPGEYAIYMALYKYTNLKLKVIRMENFIPEDINWTLANTWINPSPNIPDLESALMYVGMVFFEGTNISVGRGTTKPFIYTGAPWLNNNLVLKELQKLKLKGIKFGLIEFRPTYSLYKGELCKGIQFYPISSEFDPIQVGYEYMRIIKKIHPDKFQFKFSGNHYFIDKLWGSDSYRISIETDLHYKEFRNLWQSESDFFYQFIQNIKLY
ncbi:MAG: hypothetical protein KatS3mg129_2133 [Leptospiraceae bacterium]|nr:MAG: hypothetical protein KatS3mg129_2133 [Leptospiraceae bacterium]